MTGCQDIRDGIHKTAAVTITFIASVVDAEVHAKAFQHSDIDDDVDDALHRSEVQHFKDWPLAEARWIKTCASF